MARCLHKHYLITQNLKIMKNNNLKNEQQCAIHGVRRSYLVVSEMDVINIILGTAEDWQGVGIISPSNIASLLKTSRYQVDKHIRSLKKQGLIEYNSVMIGGDEDYYTPYNGYGLTKEGKVKFAKELKKIEDRNIELIKECFGG